MNEICYNNLLKLEPFNYLFNYLSALIQILMSKIDTKSALRTINNNFGRLFTKIVQLCTINNHKIELNLFKFQNHMLPTFNYFLLYYTLNIFYIPFSINIFKFSISKYSSQSFYKNLLIQMHIYSNVFLLLNRKGI